MLCIFTSKLIHSSSRKLLTKAMTSVQVTPNLLHTSLNGKDSPGQQEAMMNELCITVNENDVAIGHQSKKDCHLMENIDKGLLHRAFSVLLFNQNNELLITRRADCKITFPSYYTNACCSHPLFSLDPEREEKDALGIRRAAHRKLHQELGIKLSDINLEDIKYITRILYKSPSSGVWGEHELDYILVVHKDVHLDLNPDEVSEAFYVKKNDLAKFLEDKEQSGSLISPWFKLICDKFLLPYWNNLEKFVDHKKIHRFI